MTTNEEALGERDYSISSGLKGFLAGLGVASWQEIPPLEREQHRTRLQGLGFMIKGTGELEPIHNSASFGSTFKSRLT